MAGTSAGISGVAVAVASVGGVLVYAGFRGVSPIQALRDVTSGKPAPVVGNPTSVPSSASASGESGFGDASRGAVVSAAQKYSGDIYNQPKRRQAGYSDCSSFVDKALKDAGIDPPSDPWATTGMYRLSSEWKTVPQSQSQPGDIAISAGHMVLVTGQGGSSGIGQQRSGVNVRTGSVASLFGKVSYVYKTYTGYTKTPGANTGSGGGGGGSW